MQNNCCQFDLLPCPFPDVGEQPVSWGEQKNPRAAKNFKAIVDMKTGKVFSIVSEDYRLIRHEEAITEVEQELSKTKGLGRYEAITEFTNDGGRMRRTYRFKGNGAEIKKGDPIYPATTEEEWTHLEWIGGPPHVIPCFEV